MTYYEGYIKQIKLNGFINVTGYVDSNKVEQDRLIFLKDIYIGEGDKYLYREFLRKNFLRKKVRWNLQGEVTFTSNNADLTKIVLQEGYGRVKGKIDDLKKIYETAVKGNKGLHNPELDKTTLPTMSDVDKNKELYEKYKDKPTLCTIEEVVNASLYKITFLNDNILAFVILDGLMGWGTENHYELLEDEGKYSLPYKFIESKKLAEFVCLNREVGIKLSGLDNAGNLIGILYYSRQDMFKIYKELLAIGAAKLTSFISELPIDAKEELQALQNEAQSEKLMIWKPLESSINETVQGRVLEVHSGDCVSVVEDSTSRVMRVNLAGIKAPSMGGNVDKETWAEEAKTYLLSLSLGQAVNCKIEFMRTTQNNNKLIFATLTLPATQQNLSIEMSKAGWVNLILSRESEPELGYMANLKNLRNEAEQKQLGQFRQKGGLIKMFTDLTNDKNKFLKFASVLVPNKTKMGQAIAMKSQEAFVEAVLSPTKLRLRLIKDEYIINFYITGVSPISNDPNNAESKFYNDAIIFSKLNISQRNAKIEIENYDKYGNFYGYIYVDNTMFNEVILKSGYGHVQHNSSKARAFTKIYEQAKQNESGVFRHQLYKATEISTLNKNIQYYFSDVYDTYNIYIRENSEFNNDLELKVQKAISSSLGDLDKLETPCKNDTMCLVKDPECNEYFRGAITSTKGKSFEVVLYDYGTYMSTTEEYLYRLPLACHRLPRVAIPVYLLGLVLPDVNTPGADQTITYIQEELSNKEAIFLGKIEIANQTSGVIMYTSEKDKERNELAKSFNTTIVKEGYAIADTNESDRDLLTVLKSSQSHAISQKAGLWPTGELEILDN